MTLSFSELAPSDKVLPANVAASTGGNSAQFVTKTVGGKKKSRRNKKSSKKRKTQRKSCKHGGKKSRK
jgi:hypothetical protein